MKGPLPIGPRVLLAVGAWLHPVPPRRTPAGRMGPDRGRRQTDVRRLPTLWLIGGWALFVFFSFGRQRLAANQQSKRIIPCTICMSAPNGD
jgi:hypothetical protein